MEISRLPSHGFFVGSPPKLQGHEILQLQLSATVAVRCQFASAARGGTADNETKPTRAIANSLRICVLPALSPTRSARLPSDPPATRAVPADRPRWPRP